MAGEFSRQKVSKFGEVVADGDSDQVVVTTLADLFDIGEALSKDNSAQLIGSMTGEILRHLTEEETPVVLELWFMTPNLLKWAKPIPRQPSRCRRVNSLSLMKTSHALG